MDDTGPNRFDRPRLEPGSWAGIPRHGDWEMSCEGCVMSESWVVVGERGRYKRWRYDKPREGWT